MRVGVSGSCRPVAIYLFVKLVVEANVNQGSWCYVALCAMPRNVQLTDISHDSTTGHG